MNFALILFILTVFTGALWLWDRYSLAPARRARAKAIADEFDSANREAIQRGEKSVIDARNAAVADAVNQPAWLDYTAGLFPVIAAVFLLRSFVVEPFRIPSGSMLPTLYIGDFILVNKYEYGVRLPILNTKIIPVGSPKRGDVVVFRYPVDEKYDYIKRVVGVPGDTVAYIDKVLTVNGVKADYKPVGDWVDPNTLVTLSESTETIDGREHRTVVDERIPAGLRGAPNERVGEGCRYYSNGFVCKVPEKSYFVLGDNRDNSEDSRYWGFVPEGNLVGRAFLIWANVSEMSRVGSFK